MMFVKLDLLAQNAGHKWNTFQIIIGRGPQYVGGKSSSNFLCPATYYN